MEAFWAICALLDYYNTSIILALFIIVVIELNIISSYKGGFQNHCLFSCSLPAVDIVVMLRLVMVQGKSFSSAIEVEAGQKHPSQVSHRWRNYDCYREGLVQTCISGTCRVENLFRKLSSRLSGGFFWIVDVIAPESWTVVRSFIHLWLLLVLESYKQNA